jgi:radical SAM-linked protein
MAMRIRAFFAKTEAMRFTSHLDLYRAWERTLRRAGLPVVFSQGYNPRPRVQLAAALPLGFTSIGEIIDIWLEGDSDDLEILKLDLTNSQPPGIDILEVIQVDPASPPLQKLITSAGYLVTLLHPIPQLVQKIDTLLTSDTISRQRRGKSYDLRPLIEELAPIPESGNSHQRLFMRLVSQEGLTGRPEEVLLAMDIPPESTRIQRTKIIFPNNVNA